MGLLEECALNVIRAVVIFLKDIQRQNPFLMRQQIPWSEDMDTVCALFLLLNTYKGAGIVIDLGAP